MPAQPDGQLPPEDGTLPASALTRVGNQGFGAYVHVPFCASRCGYCDFNTYTPQELGGGSNSTDYVEAICAEIALARQILGPTPPLDTVFFGGGTPTLLPAGQLAKILQTLEKTFGLHSTTEITTEANPESVTPDKLEDLVAAGFNRISLGMQSSAAHVLAVLERQHTPGRALAAVDMAQKAGFTAINLDLIYGTPGESDQDWRNSLADVLATGVDHVSAYALIVEDGTRLSRQVRRGQLPAPDDDVLADRYLIADEILHKAGFSWYEVSNWARSRSAQCRHNELYWRGGDWWGFGPGAHSHIGGVRWWNVKHPSTYASRLATSVSPAQGQEVLDSQARYTEEIMLGLRLAEGISLARLHPAGRQAAARAVQAGYLVASHFEAGRIVLTTQGRLLADGVVRDLLD